MKTKAETYELLKQIRVYYNQFQIDQPIIDGWHEALLDYSYETLHTNLLNYVTQSSFPPKICELISRTDDHSRTVPDSTETDTLLHHQTPPANEAVVQAELAKIRKLLGIKKEEY